MGKSMILAAFELCSLNTEVERLELKAFLVKSKHGLLDMIIPKMLADNGKLPWGKIQQFLVEDVSNNFIHDFLPKSIPMHTKPMPMQNRAGYCPFCQRELNSLRAKQCLRCHKSWHGQN
jgi:hypothetical protein